ncbi:MAG: hypothetical protein HY905_03475 [Deltaproteobacteria bacterium]|nr:hypothetical protein [Deltaproteobacteria bacterium]
MNNPYRKWTCALLAAAALATTPACDDGAGGPLALSGFTDAMISSFCDFFTRCSGAGDDLFFITGGGNAAQCRQRLREAMAAGGDVEPPTVQWEAAVSHGTATWDGQLASDCMAWMSSVACDDMDSGAFELAHPECQAILQGNLAAGAACHIDGECTNGWCDDSAACPGVCVAYVAAGTACDDSTARCGPGLECPPDTSRCTAIVPETVAQRGQACDDEIGPFCAYALFCGADGTCQQTVAAGSSCATAPDSCAPGTFCLPTDGVCHAPVMATAAGVECGEAILTFCDPLANLTCDDATGRCVALPSAGQPCADYQCAIGNYCTSLMDGMCQARQPVGAACDYDRMCQTDHCEGGRCVSAAEACGSADLF